MIREIHDMIQQLKPRPKTIITIGDAITVTTIGNYSHNDYIIDTIATCSDASVDQKSTHSLWSSLAFVCL